MLVVGTVTEKEYFEKWVTPYSYTPYFVATIVDDKNGDVYKFKVIAQFQNAGLKHKKYDNDSGVFGSGAVRAANSLVVGRKISFISNGQREITVYDARCFDPRDKYHSNLNSEEGDLPFKVYSDFLQDFCAPNLYLNANWKVYSEGSCIKSTSLGTRLTSYILNGSSEEKVYSEKLNSNKPDNLVCYNMLRLHGQKTYGNDFKLGVLVTNNRITTNAAARGNHHPFQADGAEYIGLTLLSDDRSELLFFLEKLLDCLLFVKYSSGHNEYANPLMDLNLDCKFERIRETNNIYHILISKIAKINNETIPSNKCTLEEYQSKVISLCSKYDFAKYDFSKKDFRYDEDEAEIG